MIQKISLLLFACFLNLSVFGVDRIVQEFGGTGTFSSITAAVSAAADGDRIVIVNRAGGLAWQENVTINKSLAFVPAVDGTRFKFQGDFIVAPTTSGKAIRIIGMEGVLGGIYATNSAPSGPRTKVEIAGCIITGSVNFSYNNYDVTIASNEIRGDLTFRFGNIYGNDMRDNDISVFTDAVASNDVVRIIGNRADIIDWNSTAHFFYIANNFLDYNNNSYTAAISIDQIKNSGFVTNTILNNSIRVQVNTCCSGSPYGIRVGGSASTARVDVINNAIDRITSNSNTYGISDLSSAAVVASYNHVDASIISSRRLVNITPNGTNVTTLTVDVSSTDGFVTGTAVVNGGSPDNAYTDHDLTINDPGCFGGSFNISNYFPLTATPRVYHVEAPRAIFQGGTLNISAEGFDR